MRASLELQLIQKEQELWDYLKEKNYPQYLDFLFEDYIGFFLTGAYTREQALRFLASADLSDYGLNDLTCRRFSHDLALVTYKLRVRYSAGNMDTPGNFLASSLWQLSEGAWRVAFHQEGLIK